MRESIANSYVFNLIIIFIGIIIVVLVGSLSYSKTFKIKNRLVEIIEKHKDFDYSAQQEIANFLRKSGYVTKKNPKCPSKTGFETGWHSSGYKYCVYKYNTAKGYYFHVVVFISFDIPIIGDILEFPLSGETRIIYDI